MTKDKALEELFLSQTPQFDDSAAFMAKLTKRLEAVESAATRWLRWQRLLWG